MNVIVRFVGYQLTPRSIVLMDINFFVRTWHSARGVESMVEISANGYRDKALLHHCKKVWWKYQLTVIKMKHYSITVRNYGGNIR